MTCLDYVHVLHDDTHGTTTTRSPSFYRTFFVTWLESLFQMKRMSFFYFLPTFHLLYSVSRIQQTMQVVITGRERHCYAKEKGEEVVWEMLWKTHQMSPQLTTLPITKNINPLGENLALLSCPSIKIFFSPSTSGFFSRQPRHFFSSSDGTTSSGLLLHLQNLLAKRRKKAINVSLSHITFLVFPVCLFHKSYCR